MIDHDPGDEHVDAPPVTAHPLNDLLDEMIADGQVEQMSWETFHWASYHDAMRSCCCWCAAEACGEDGS